MLYKQRELLAELGWGSKRLRIDFSAGVSLAIPLQVNGPQPAFFAAVPMTATALQLDGFTGDVQQGGSCNVQLLSWAPHCHGTHTECVGHVLPEATFVLDTIDTQPCLARLISIHCTADYPQIGLQQLHQALSAGLDDCAALAIRTLPNAASKQSRNYSQQPNYPVLSTECMQFLAESSLQHLLLDTPSLDAADNPTLANHRIWWELDRWPSGASRKVSSRSVTEMIFVPDGLADGDYWLHLELSPLQSDATPSRPVLYPLKFIQDA